MAEIILEPTAQSKVIPLSIRLNDTDTSLVSQLVTNRQFSTADTDAWFSFTLEGLAATTGTFDLTLINLQDKSVFNHTDKVFNTNPFYYKLDSGTDELTNEIRHAGKWVGQLVVTLANGDSATRKFIFGIEGHILDGTVVQTILLEDYNALIASIESAKDELTQYNIDYASLIGTVTEQEVARLEAEELRVIADALRETKEGIRQATFEANEVIRDGVVDSAIEGEMISQTVATKLTEKEATYAPRLVSVEQQLAEANDRIDDIIVTPAGGITEQEIIDARDGETTLRNRLEKNQEVSNQMAKLFDPFNKFYKLKKPTGFVWTPPIDIYHNGDKLFYTDFDVATFAPAIGTGKTYYVTTTGHYANDGLTLGTALDSVKTAINKGDAGLVLVSPGLYDLNRIWGNPVFGRNVQIKKNGEGRVIISYHLNDVWTLASGYTKTYTTTRANVRHVFDAKYPDYLGDYTKYVLKSTVAEVEATAGSYAQIDTALYVHSIDDRKPDVDTRPYLSGRQETAQIQQSVSVYVEGIEFEGSFRPFYAQNSSANPTGLKIYMKDCKFKYSNNGSGMTVVGAEECFLQNCETSRNYFDGFSYTGAYGVEPKGIEVDCIGRNIGGIDAGGGTSCNGSTSHLASHIVRFRGSYFENYGANIADVNSGTESWNIACSCHESTISEDVATASDFMVGNGVSKMWIDSCVSFGSLYGVASTTAEALVFLRKTNPDKNANITANVSNY